MIETVDFYVRTSATSQSSAKKGASSKRKTQVDPKPYKRRVREILRAAVQDWGYGEDDDNISYEMANLMDDAIAFAHKGDGLSAMILLKGITEGCVQSWDIIEEFLGGMDPIDFDVGRCPN